MGQKKKSDETATEKVARLAAELVEACADPAAAPAESIYVDNPYSIALCALARTAVPERLAYRVEKYPHAGEYGHAPNGHHYSPGAKHLGLFLRGVFPLAAGTVSVPVDARLNTPAKIHEAAQDGQIALADEIVTNDFRLLVGAVALADSADLPTLFPVL